MNWEIVHVPGKERISLEESLVDVLVANVEPKTANGIVRKLNQVCPLENLRHVKRVRRRTIEGKVELSVILCFAGKDDNHVGVLTSDLNQLIKDNQLSLFSAKVAKNPALSREEWEEQCMLWPTSYHPSTNPDGVAGLKEEDMESIFKYMKMAIQSTKLSFHGGRVVNSAVIVDPLNRQVIANATDETFPWSTSTCEPSSKYVDQDSNRDSVISDASDMNVIANNQESSLPGWSSCVGVDSYTGVSCLNPWGWMKQGPSYNSSDSTTGKFSWHPLRHAALVAIERAAARDRQLFPGSVSRTQFEIDDYRFDNSPVKRQKIQEDDSAEETSDSDSATGAIRPYLCTGFDIYLVWEPCTMCAMALVHQRIRRIFFAFPNPNAGALGSIYRLQGEKSLNHHYSVFRIMVPDKIFHEINLNGMENSCREG